MSSHQFELSDHPTDPVSRVKFAPHSTKLLVASWDKNLYLHEISGNSSTLTRKFEHRAPILDVCWSEDETHAYTVGVDHDVRSIDLSSGTQTVLSSHTMAANGIVLSPAHNLLISSSWDKTLHIHLLTSPSRPHSTIRLPAKPFCISASPSKLIVAMSARQIHIYDLAELFVKASEHSSAGGGGVDLTIEPYQRRESSLKFMTRAVACMPDDAGFASSSIEGRIAVEWFDDSPESQARKYAFKCHRQASPDDGIDTVYPVNALVFHPVHGTFASGGGEGVVAVWDALAKRRIRQYGQWGGGKATSVASIDFSADGRLLAVGTSPMFDGEKEVGDGDGEIRVTVRELAEGEVRSKGAK